MSMFFGTADGRVPASKQIGMPNPNRKNVGVQMGPDPHGREGYVSVNGVVIPDPNGTQPQYAHLPDDVAGEIAGSGGNPEDYYLDRQGNLLSLASQDSTPPQVPKGRRDAPAPQEGPAPAGAGGDYAAQDPQASRVGMYARESGVGVQGQQQPQGNIGYQPSPYERAYMQAMNTMHDLAYAASDPHEAWRQGIRGPVQQDPRYVAAMQQVDALGGLINQQMMADVERQRVGVSERELAMRQEQNQAEQEMLRNPEMLAISFARENQLPPTAIPGLVSQFEKMFGQAGGAAVPGQGASVLTPQEQQAYAGALPAEAQRLLMPDDQGNTAGVSIPSIVETLDRLNVQGLNDPNSEVGRLLLSEIQSRYGNDDEALSQALMYPDMEDPRGGDWFDRNIGSLGVGLMSLGGLNPLTGDSFESLWYQGDEGVNRKRAVDLYNQYQQQLGGRQLGWQGRDFGFLPPQR